jgi:hypothetical protein
MQWTSKSSPNPNKFYLQKSKIKTMLIASFDKQAVIHKEFLPEGQRFNRKIVEVHYPAEAKFRAEGSWVLLHDNAPSHSALVVKTFLAKQAVMEISHPPYSPDLALAIFFPFPAAKTFLKGKRFQGVEGPC